MINGELKFKILGGIIDYDLQIYLNGFENK
jgi:hypothetical protein